MWWSNMLFLAFDHVFLFGRRLSKWAIVSFVQYSRQYRALPLESWMLYWCFLALGEILFVACSFHVSVNKATYVFPFLCKTRKVYRRNTFIVFWNFEQDQQPSTLDHLGTASLTNLTCLNDSMLDMHSFWDDRLRRPIVHARVLHVDSDIARSHPSSICPGRRPFKISSGIRYVFVPSPKYALWIPCLSPSPWGNCQSEKKASWQCVDVWQSNFLIVRTNEADGDCSFVMYVRTKHKRMLHSFTTERNRHFYFQP